MEPLLESDIHPDPIEQFRRWFDAAVAAEVPEPTAMALATASDSGFPSARMVLLKGFDADGFRFFSNYRSLKGEELDENPYAALLFFWPQLHRQIRIEGDVLKVTPEVSDAYFASRPRGSQIAAFASQQSSTLDDRAELEGRVCELESQYKGREIPRPERWGGYRVIPNSFEFWQARENRLHDRLLYSLQDDGAWSIARLSP